MSFRSRKVVQNTDFDYGSRLSIHFPLPSKSLLSLNGTETKKEEPGVQEPVSQKSRNFSGAFRVT